MNSRYGSPVARLELLAGARLVLSRPPVSPRRSLPGTRVQRVEGGGPRSPGPPPSPFRGLAVLH